MSESGKNTEIKANVTDVWPYPEAVNTLAKGIVAGSAEFWTVVCRPAAEQIGLLAKEAVQWRFRNACKVMDDAKGRLVENSNVHCPPRIALQVIEKGSWEETAALQEMWSGLLVSACTEFGDDDSNLIFVNLLADMTPLQVRILKFACENSAAYLLPGGLPVCDTQGFDIAEFSREVSESDVERISREMENLRGSGLIIGVVNADYRPPRIELAPTGLGLDMYIRCQGSRKSPAEYFDLPTSTTTMRTTPAPDPIYNCDADLVAGEAVFVRDGAVFRARAETGPNYDDISQIASALIQTKIGPDRCRIQRIGLLTGMTGLKSGEHYALSPARPGAIVPVKEFDQLRDLNIPYWLQKLGRAEGESQFAINIESPIGISIGGG